MASASTSTALHPVGLWHVVALAATDRVSNGGIVLPETWHTNYNTAVVQQSGFGLELGNGAVLPPMAQPGDVVLYDLGAYHVLDAEKRLGFVRDGDLCAWIDPETDNVVPLGDWVLIAQDEAPETTGLIAHTELWTQRPRSGVVVDVGPGRLRTYGKYAGTRKSVECEVGAEIEDRRVYWGCGSDILCVGRTHLECLLIRAGDLIAVEEETDADRQGEEGR